MSDSIVCKFPISYFRIKVAQVVKKSPPTHPFFFIFKGSPYNLSHDSPRIELHESTLEHASWCNGFWPQCQVHEIYSSRRKQTFLTTVSHKNFSQARALLRLQSGEMQQTRERQRGLKGLSTQYCNFHRFTTHRFGEFWQRVN